MKDNMFFPELNKETILKRIKPKKGLSQMNSHTTGKFDTQLSYQEDLNKSIQNAQDNAAIGDELGTMSKQKGAKRWFAKIIGNTFLRVARIITRDQKIVNQSLIDGISTLKDEIEVQKDGYNQSIEMIRQENDHSLSELKIYYENALSEINEKFKQKLNEIENDNQKSINDMKKYYLEHIGNLKQNIDRTSNRIDELEVNVRNNEKVLSNLGDSLNSLEEKNTSEITNMSQKLSKEINEREIQNSNRAHEIHSLKSIARGEGERVSIILKELRKYFNNSSTTDQVATIINNESRHDLDDLYLSFENLFRGTREEIKRKVQVHLVTIEKNHMIGKQDYPILDIGCGRGEWLELLKEQKMEVKGLDLNRAMVEYCKDIDLPVVKADVFEYLKDSPDESFGAVTGFHIIEHLEFHDQYDLLQEIYRVLKPGGLILLETPNPKNLIVGASNFNGDPTHISPVFPDTLKFLYDFVGFVDTENKYLNPMSEISIPEDTIISKRFNELMYGAQDFATVGWKV